jgi:CRISPR/Cas system-associated exonuclease Cas4 (RecB family)
VALPDNFQFSQGNLQDYVDCPRRFQLRHVLMQPWPGLITGRPGELEEHMQRGARFHHLAHQHALGIDVQGLTASIEDPVLAGWWQTFLLRPISDLPEAVRRAEVVVTASLRAHRLVAKFDLLAIEPGQRVVVVDWKTSLKRPQRAVLARRLQTLVYRYLAVEAGAAFNGGHLPQPERVEMVYWLAAFDGAVERFPYDSAQHAAARAYLGDLIAEILSHQEDTWPLTADEHRCRFCNYRSLCERQVQPGFVDELEEDLEPLELEIDLEQVAEVEF